MTKEAELYLIKVLEERDHHIANDLMPKIKALEVLKNELFLSVGHFVDKDNKYHLYSRIYRGLDIVIDEGTYKLLRRAFEI